VARKREKLGIGISPGKSLGKALQARRKEESEAVGLDES
jgi:hypothetical protein